MDAQLKPHKFSEFLPLMTEAEFRSLKADIAANGQQEPIMRFENKILDGRNRYRACLELKIKPEIIDFSGSEAEALNFVYSKANHRHMSESQRATAGVFFLRYFENDAKNRLKTSGKEVVPEARRGQSRDLAGDMLGVSGRYISEAKRLFETNQPLFYEVFEGKLKLTQAVAKVRKAAGRKMVGKKAAVAGEIDEENCRLILGDAITELECLKANSIDCVFTDPPYNIGKKYHGDKTGDDLKDDEFLRWCSAWLAECARVLKPGGTIFVMINGAYAGRLETILRAADLKRRNTIYWWENNPENQRGNFSDAVRQIHYFVKGDGWTFDDSVKIPSKRNEIGDKRGIVGGKLPDNVWIDNRIPGNALDRVPFEDAPPQLPVNICETAIRVATRVGDVVLDPFNGNGTTAIAALRHGRKYIGIERSEKYLNQSKKWIAANLAASPKE